MSGSLLGLLGQGRQLAESLMADTCELARPGGRTWDEDAGEHRSVPGPVVYAGRCKVQRTALEARATGAGERLVTVERVQLHLPLSVTDVAVGDLATITAARDPALVGRVLRVSTDPAKTFATARRLTCEDTTA